MFKKSTVPHWVEKRIINLYKQSIKNVLYWRKAIIMEQIATGKTDELRRKYAFAVGEMSALESIMDRLFIPYDDHGAVPEIRI